MRIEKETITRQIDGEEPKTEVKYWFKDKHGDLYDFAQFSEEQLVDIRNEINRLLPIPEVAERDNKNEDNQIEREQ